MVVLASSRLVDLVNGERDQCGEESLERTTRVAIREGGFADRGGWSQRYRWWCCWFKVAKDNRCSKATMFGFGEAFA